jgi:hypothetical protein
MVEKAEGLSVPTINSEVMDWQSVPPAKRVCQGKANKEVIYLVYPDKNDFVVLLN